MPSWLIPFLAVDILISVGIVLYARQRGRR